MFQDKEPKLKAPQKKKKNLKTREILENIEDDDLDIDDNLDGEIDASSDDS
jgi:hypothetical protein